MIEYYRLVGWKEMQILSGFSIIQVRTSSNAPRQFSKRVSEFGGGNTLVSALRADPILHSETLFENLRYSLYKIQTFFESNPDEEI